MLTQLKNTFDIVVIGAGILGLSAAYSILRRFGFLKICIVEKETGPAFHQTGHNSGVIHSGIYYKPGSLKALNCRRGYGLMTDFCEEREIPFEICGKLILATREDELEKLQVLYKRGLENGLSGCKLISGNEITEFEPHAKGIGGIYVPQTGIVDFKQVSLELAKVLVNRKCEIIYGEEVKSIRNSEKNIEVRTNRRTVEAKLCIACAGLFADRIARLSGTEPDFRIIPFRGEYYKLRHQDRKLVRNLIYPVPDPEFPFLGVHFTRRIDGSIEAGPNAVLAFSREGYRKFDFNLKDSFDTLAFQGFRKLAHRYLGTGIGEFRRSFSKRLFADSLQRLVPEITMRSLIKGGSGVRAQACGKDGSLIDDFLIIGERSMINVCNAPSPAATASLSIGMTISEIAIDKLNL